MFFEKMLAMDIVRGIAMIVVATIVIMMRVMFVGVSAVICWIVFAMPVLGLWVI